MAILGVLRLLTFIFVLGSALAVLGLGAYILRTTTTEDGGFLFIELGIAAGGLTGLALLSMLVLGFRARAFTSRIWFELTALGILSTAWIVTGVTAAMEVEAIYGGHSCAYSYYEFDILACREFTAFTAIAFSCAFFLILYAVALLAFTIRAHLKHNVAWTTSVRAGFNTAAGDRYTKASARTRRAEPARADPKHAHPDFVLAQLTRQFPPREQPENKSLQGHPRGAGSISGMPTPESKLGDSYGFPQFPAQYYQHPARRGEPLSGTPTPEPERQDPFENVLVLPTQQYPPQPQPRSKPVYTRSPAQSLSGMPLTEPHPRTRTRPAGKRERDRA